MIKGCNLSKLGRKGAIIDAIPIMIYTFAFALVCVVSFVIYDGLVDNNFFTLLEANSHGGLNATQLQQNADTAYDTLDFMVLFVFIGSTLAAVIGAILIRSHPAFFFISIIVLMIQVFIAMALSNTWYELINNSNLVDAKAQFTTANYVLSNFPVFILIAVILLAIVIYAINPLGVE